MYKNKKTAVFAFVGIIVFGPVVWARAEDTFEEAWNVHFQTIVGSIRLNAQY